MKPTEEWGPARNVNRKEAGYSPLPNQYEDDEFDNPTPPPAYSNVAYVTDDYKLQQNGHANQQNREPAMNSVGIDTLELEEMYKANQLK